MENPISPTSVDGLLIMREYSRVTGPSPYQIETMDQCVLVKILDILHENCNNELWGCSGTHMYHIRFENIHLELPSIQDKDGFFVDCSASDAKRKRMYYNSMLVGDMVIELYKRSEKDAAAAVEKKDIDDDMTTTSLSRVFDCKLDATRKARGKTVGPEWVLEQKRIHTNMVITDIPAIVGSAACYYFQFPSADAHRALNNFPRDVSDQFICKGVSRMANLVEKLDTNKVVDDGINLQIRCAADFRWRSTSTLKLKVLDRQTKGVQTVGINIPYSNKNFYIPIQMIFRLLGFKTPEAAAACVASRGSTVSDNGLGFEIKKVKCLPAYTWALQAMQDSPGSKIPNPWIMDRDSVAVWVSLRGKMKRSNADRGAVLANMAKILRDEILPNVGLKSTDKILLSKARYMAKLVWKLWAFEEGVYRPPNRDHYANKRFESAGFMIGTLFRQLMVSIHGNSEDYLEGAAAAMAASVAGDSATPLAPNLKRRRGYRKAVSKFTPKSIAESLASSYKRLSSNMRNAVAKGTFTKRTSKAQTGVTEMVNHFSHLSTLAQKRRVTNRGGGLAASSSKLQLDPSCWGFLCPASTPEGQTISTIKALALMARPMLGITRFDIESTVKYCLGGLLLDLAHVDYMLTKHTSMSLDDVSVWKNYADGVEAGGFPRPESLYGSWTVDINGTPIGVTHLPIVVHQVLIGLRLRRQIPKYTAIVWDDVCHEIRILADVGNIRAAFGVTSKLAQTASIVHNWKVSPPSMLNLWEQLERAGCVEWLGPEELLTRVVGLGPDDAFKNHRSHYLLHQTATLGLCAAVAPLCNFNQAPRVTYQIAMGKQALSRRARGAYWMSGYETIRQEVPVSYSYVESFFEGTREPRTTNSVVMVGAYTCYNTDDATIFNKQSIETGKFDVVVYRVYMDTVITRENNKHTLGIPSKDVIGRTTGDYSHLDPKTGIIKIGSPVGASTVLIGKTVAVKDIGHARQFRT